MKRENGVVVVMVVVVVVAAVQVGIAAPPGA